ncbi:hypothetical protein [Leptospira neocaledonica]|uniref:Tetratricopeptide repeat protein n=1 Tax=Leptospira neocaledonica TaxID=2023192 RepID=A0A2N0A3Q9_9LEPT|nr:hypothetical protein [Leptospira neocaledonica]PJZ78937.1 hypothetical protein CH365_01535 [Leptospira neocaledonica]
MFRSLLIFATLLGLTCATTNSGKKPGPESFTLDCSDTKSPYYFSVMKGKGNFSITRFLEYSIPSSAHENFLSQNQKIWDKALFDYRARKFSEVKALLQPFLSKYDQDLSLRELYAKSWYWSLQNRGKEDKLLAFYLDLYKRIQHEIDVQDGIRKKGEVVIVLGFNDVEWKIATIYLDRAEWQAAESYLELSLFGGTMTTDGSQGPHPSVIENYAYLTETAYYLKDKDKNRFYLCKTLQLDPKNTYAFQFLLR